jgi:N-methylhydantoinase A
MHAAFLAQELEVPEVIVPRFPGAFSAWGMLETEIRKDFARAYFLPLADVDRDDLARVLDEQEAEALAALEEEGIEAGQGRVEHAIDVRYVGQEYTLTIPVLGAAEPRDDGFAAALSGRFDEAHDQRFGHANPGAPVELVAVRSTGLGDLGRAQPERLSRAGGEPAADERPIVFGRSERQARVVRRDDLAPGAELAGPAVVVEATATTVVPPGSTLRVDELGTLVIAIGQEDA